MERFSKFSQDSFGNLYTNITVTVYDKVGGGLATLFSDYTGTPESNPFTSAGDGEISFYAVNGRYDVVLSGTVNYTILDVTLFDPSDDTSIGDMQILSNDLTINNGSPATQTPFAISSAVGDVVSFDSLFYFSAVDSAADISIKVSSPGAGSDYGMCWAKAFNKTTDALIVEEVNVEDIYFNVAATTGNEIAVNAKGFIQRLSGGVGNTQLIFKQQTPHASNLTLARGSWCRWNKGL